LWAKQIFKTKPNHEVAVNLKEKIKTIFHHLTKDELIDKLLANYLIHSKTDNFSKSENQKKKSK
jgi:ATP-dependent RNA helicase DeaD